MDKFHNIVIDVDFDIYASPTGIFRYTILSVLNEFPYPASSIIFRRLVESP